MSNLDPNLDHRSLLVVEIHDLQRRAGTVKELHRQVPAPAGMGVEMIAVPEGSLVSLDFKIESVVEGVLVTGFADAEVVGQCSRCLSDINYQDSFDFQELYFYPGFAEEDEDDYYEVKEEAIDLEGVLRDAVVLELPFTPLCRDDCLGLCPSCGTNLNNDPEHRHDDQIDPRWADLAKL
ncbi:MAG: metal-binding protein [Propionibacterium sp.]|nr:MAG: metal-binding protein [Propionibacterium sp.]